MLVGLAVKSTFVENQDRDPGIRFTCSTTSCVEMHFDSFTCFRDLLEA
jgi:hypothetical protein